MPSLHLQIAGRVQGVGFRWFLRVAGRRLRVAGWVMNRPDGTVEVAASGQQDALDELRRLAGKGPLDARVSEVRELDSPVEDLPFPFTMRKSGAS
ncbi:MAG: acylphosphatase [Gemmatimonadota bacterium]|nr:acylphosphatase [Gemmatimonadota bacterium]